MKQENDIFSELIRGKMETYSIPLESGLWDDLEHRIYTEKRKKILFWQVSGLVAVAACLALLFLLKPLKQDLSPDRLLSDAADDTIYHSESEPESLTDLATNLFQESLPELLAERTDSRPEPKPALVEKPEVVTEAKTEIEETSPIEDPKEIESETTISLPEFEFTFEKDPFDDYLDKVKSKSAYALAFSVGGASSRGLFILGDNSNVFDNNPHLNFDRDFHFAGATSSSISEGWKSDLELVHSAPQTFSLSLRKSIHPYLALESGLTYTYLQSRNKGSSDQMQFNSRLYYLGVPLSLVLTGAGIHPKVDLYLSAGGMVEKGIYSDIRLRSKAGELYQEGVIDGLQWSVHSSVGLGYKIYNNMSFYIEPRLVYYFDNKQPISVRKAQDFNLSLNGGIRFNW